MEQGYISLEHGKWDFYFSDTVTFCCIHSTCHSWKVFVCAAAEGCGPCDECADQSIGSINAVGFALTTLFVCCTPAPPPSVGRAMLS